VKDSDPMPLSGDPDLTSDERLAFRKWLRDQQRIGWLWRQLKWLGPLVAGFAAATWQVIDWASKHIHFK